MWVVLCTVTTLVRVSGLLLVLCAPHFCLTTRLLVLIIIVLIGILLVVVVSPVSLSVLRTTLLHFTRFTRMSARCAVRGY